MSTLATERRAETRQDKPQEPLLFVVWIDTNCGHEIEPDWEIDGPMGREIEPLPQALKHSALCQAAGYPTLLMLPGQTPRADGLMSNPRYPAR